MTSVMIFDKERVTVDSGITIEKAVSASGRFSDTYIYVINGTPVPMTTVIENDVEIKAIRIASGG